MASVFKYIIPFFLLLAAIFYSVYSKNKITEMSSDSGSISESQQFILSELPMSSFINFTGKEISSADFKNHSNLFFVHLWGTWCGPCESEFGDILVFAEAAKNLKVNFYLVAVNDDLVKVSKFLARFKKIPENVHVLLDNKNTAMDLFGTYKVPETFLFSQKGKTLNKYVGPQVWTQEIYLTQLHQYLKY